MTVTVITAGRKVGRGQLSNDRDILAAIQRGETVYVKRNGVWLSVAAPNDILAYTALPARPEGVEG